MADTMTFGDYTYTNNEAGYNQFVSDVNSGKLHVEDFAGNFFSDTNKLDDYFLNDFKDKNLSIVTYADTDDPSKHLMRIVNPSNSAEVDALKNITIGDANNDGSITLRQYSHGTWAEEETLYQAIDKGLYKTAEGAVIHSNSPQGGGDIIAGTNEAAERGAKAAVITNNILEGHENVKMLSEGISLGNWHNLNVMKNMDFSKLGPDGKINISFEWLPSFGPFTTSIDKHVEAFKELCKDPEFVKHLGTIYFDIDPGTGSKNKFHPPKATAEFWDKCMEDPEVKKILEEHTTQETKDKIAGIDRDAKSYWDKLQMGIIIAVAVIAVITIVAVCVHLYRKHKKKEAQKKAEEFLKQGQGNSPMPAQPVMCYPVIMPSNYQSCYNLQSCVPQQTMNQENQAQNYQEYYQQYQQQYQYMMNNNQQSNYNLQNVGQAQGQWR